MWRLSIVDDESNRTVVNLVRKQYTIGRAEENAVRLTERNVSRRHAVLERSDKGWQLRDLQSCTGSFVNDERIDGSGSVKHGDRIRIGDYEVTLTDSEREVAEAANSERDAATVPEIPASSSLLEKEDRLVVIEGTGVGTQFPLRESPTLIGRGEECDIPLNDTSVSRQHCVLERDEHGRFQVHDKNSSNGVRVNGMEVSRMTLYAGDVIELGDIQLQFVPRGTRFDRSVLSSRKPATPARKRMNRLAPLGLALAVLGGVLGVVALRQPEQPIASRGAEASEAAMELLRVASEQHAKHDLEAAHATLQRVATGSTLRNSQEYKRIEAAWADEQFELAERTQDLEVQRALLDRVAQTASVDSMRRKQAVDQLARLSQQRLSPTPADLGRADAGVEPATEPSTNPADSAPSPVAALPLPAKARVASAPKPLKSPTPSSPTAAANSNPTDVSAAVAASPRPGSPLRPFPALGVPPAGGVPATEAPRSNAEPVPNGNPTPRASVGEAAP